MWYGHVSRREESYVEIRVLEMEVEGVRTRGRPKRRWMDCVRNYLKGKQLSVEDVHDWVKWRQTVKNIEPAQSGKKCMEKEEEEVKRLTKEQKEVVDICTK